MGKYLILEILWLKWFCYYKSSFTQNITLQGGLPEQFATYLHKVVDQNNGNRDYALYLNEPVPVGAFWSITAYGEDGHMLHVPKEFPNNINRFFYYKFEKPFHFFKFFCWTKCRWLLHNQLYEKSWEEKCAIYRQRLDIYCQTLRAFWGSSQWNVYFPRAWTCAKLNFSFPSKSSLYYILIWYFSYLIESYRFLLEVNEAWLYSFFDLFHFFINFNFYFLMIVKNNGKILEIFLTGIR